MQFRCFFDGVVRLGMFSFVLHIIMFTAILYHEYATVDTILRTDLEHNEITSCNGKKQAWVVSESHPLEETRLHYNKVHKLLQEMDCYLGACVRSRIIDVRFCVCITSVFFKPGLSIQKIQTAVTSSWLIFAALALQQMLLLACGVVVNTQVMMI